MEVNLNGSKECIFSQVKAGDVFTFNNNPFMKIREIWQKQNDEYLNAIDLKNGDSSTFKSHENVILRNGAIITIT